MTFLPIVNRELRVASREWRTYAQRCSVLGAAMLLTLWMGGVSGRTSAAAFGQQLFHVLLWTAFVVSIISGLIVTSDSISREKRDGTLGFLFLTDLRAYDIVLGKFAVTSVNILYGLMGVVPMLMISLLFGGITAGEVARAALALLLCLLFAICCGLFASASCTKASNAFSSGVSCVLLTMAVLPLAALAISHGVWDTAPPDWVIALNPAYALANVEASDYQTKTLEFWVSCGSSLACSVLLFAVASLRTRRSWQERPEGAAKLRLKDRLRQWAYGSTRRRLRVRRRWLDRNPVVWLGRRHLLKPWFAWAPLLAALALYAWALYYQYKYHEKLTGEPIGVIVVAYLVNLMYKLVMASEAGQCFAEDRRVGALEQLAGTALTTRDIIWGRLRALFFTYIWAISATLLLEWGFFLACDFRKSHENEEEIVATAIVGTFVFVADLVAVGFLSMWTGLKTRNPVRGTTSAIWWILILPWLAMVVIQTMMQTHEFSGMLAMYAMVSLLIGGAAISLSLHSMRKYLRVLAVNPALLKLRDYSREADLFRKAGAKEEAL
ncbi:MAG: ABC transporter permease [Verrucomicrobiota bacterium]